ncbi:phospholipase D family protein [Puniceibacterium confluentis]|uniref:phospholipase D family protein n=1 Tax=Puniceibacterium confluentis TaxID=1958944 RepID=UPI0011B7361F|nr:phospholipase D family protein [Puniceibacterium confluentis]
MPRFFDGPALRTALQEAYSDEPTARLAVAYWGDGAAETLGLKGDQTCVVCNLLGGGTNPAEVRHMIEKGVQVRHRDGLHAKLGIVGSVSFLGSSNMSANGLGGESAMNDWAEANILYSSHRKEIVSMFDAFWKDGLAVTADDIELAQRRWNLRCEAGQQANRITLHPEPLADALQTRPEDFEHTYFAVYDELTEPEEIETVNLGDAEAKRRHGPACQVYWDWQKGELPAEGYIVDFRTPRSSGQRALELFVRQTSCEDFSIGNNKFHPALATTEFAGAGIGSRQDRQRLRNAMSAYLKVNPLDDERARCGKISELARYLDQP